MTDSPLESAYRLLDQAVMVYEGRPIGTVAARAPDSAGGGKLRRVFCA